MIDEAEKQAVLDDYKHYIGTHKRYMLNAGWEHARMGIESQSADPNYMIGYGKWLKLSKGASSNDK